MEKEKLKMKNREKILKMAEFALLAAIVIIFQLLGSFGLLKIGTTSLNLVLIPVVIGSIVLGLGAGTILGLIGGLITLWAGISGVDPFTEVLFGAQPFFTALICLVKMAAAGFGAGVVYRLIKNKNTFAATFAAAAAAPIINTGLFILGGLFLVGETLKANFVGDGNTLLYFLVIGCAGLNFIVEFVLNIVVSPAINTIVKAVSSRIKK